MSGIITGGVIGLIVLFFVCRELMCWYYKINNIIELLEEQNRLLSNLNNKTSSIVNQSGIKETSGYTAVSKSSDVDTKKCNRCGHRVNANVFKCPKCGADSFV